MLWLLACASPDPTDTKTGVRPDTTDSTVDSADSTDRDTTGDSPGDSPVDSGPVTVADVSVTVNPAVATVLEVGWTLDRDVEDVWLTWRVGDGDWSTSPARAGTSGAHTEAVLGVPADTDVEVRIVTEAGGTATESESYTGHTDPLPSEVPVPELVSWDPLLTSPAPWLLISADRGPGSYDGPVYTEIVDREGRVVWYHLTTDDRLTLYAQPSADGTHLLLDENAFYTFGAATPGVERLTLDLGYDEFTELDDFGFAIDEMEDGSLLYEGRDGADKALVELAPDGTKTVVWDCTQWHADNGYATDDWSTMPNTLVWDATQGTVLWSMFTTDTVVEVAVPSGEVVRQFGQLAGGWAFDPPESVVDYQHYPNYTPEGDIIVSTHVKGEPHQQRTRVFELDDSAQTLREIWTFGEGVDHYADYAGEAHEVDGGNRLIGYGTDGATLEVTDTGEIAWELAWEQGGITLLTGHQTLLTDLYALNAGPADR